LTAVNAIRCIIIKKKIRKCSYGVKKYIIAMIRIYFEETFVLFYL
jgi:hypothetical protein